MSSIGTQRVPFEGPESSKILLVGEAPGGEEEGSGRPFVGISGQLLQRYLERQGLDRSQVRLANLCKYRPRGNKFEVLLGSSQLEEGLNELEEEIKKNKPNVVVALGGWPLWFLTGKCTQEKRKDKPGSGIMLYRGSRLPALGRFGENQKVLATFHPSFVNRSWYYNPIFNFDLMNAREDSTFPELRYPEYREYIDPPPDVLYDLVSNSLKAPWIAQDIETFPTKKFSCVGWAYQGVNDPIPTGVCITYKRQDLWRFAKEVWESDTPKIFQYATYDIPFMDRFYSWKIGGFYGAKGWDTYVAAASIMPDYPRALYFLISLYTRFPYYKAERHHHRESGDMTTLWKYNIKDNVGTLQVAMEQMKEIPVLFDKAA